MNWEEYRVHARKTCADEAFTSEHFIEGIFNEAGELMGAVKKRFYGKDLDLVNMKEEMGDLAWYMANLSSWLEEKADVPHHFNPHPKLQRDAKTCIYQIGAYAGALIDALVANKPLDMKANLNWVSFWTKALADVLELPWSEVFEANCRKLAIRYPDGVFNPDHAVNRDKEAERAALEGPDA